MKPTIFFVIPAYQESACIGSVVRQIRAKYDNVVVVDDGSRDNTAVAAVEAGAIVLRHLINRGQGAAIKTGIDFSLLHGADVIVTFDSDGQHQVQDVETLLAPILHGQCEVSLGSRFLCKDNRIPWVRRLTLRLGVFFTRLVSAIRVTDTHNGLRALSRKAAQQIHIRQDRMAHASEILDEISRLRLSYLEVPTRVLYTDYSRKKGQASSAAFRIAWDFMIGKSDR